MTARVLYAYQKRVAELLLQGTSVVLQAPTGAGKTYAALFPFLYARRYMKADEFPRKCIYSVPMRVLATQFNEEWREEVKENGWRNELAVTIQTGAESADAKLEGDLIFTTIDQTLSNFLSIPYALGGGQANLTAGAVLSSYLVVDELHLLDPGSTLPTTLHMLKLVKGIAPFLVMTATFSQNQVEALAKLLGAEPIIVTGNEAQAIPSQQKTRKIATVDETLTAEAILAQHGKRSIAFCNTVQRAQELYEALQGAHGIEVRLLHSRFLREDRDATETWLRREFGKKPADYTVDSAILVTTQAAEVGVDITSERLHTESAPASSVLQRAGRCARYQGETGEVFVYRLPVNDEDHTQYAPYHEKEQREITDLTWASLAQRSGAEYTFDDEMALVDEAHGAADRRVLEELEGNRGLWANKITATIRTQERGSASELIRDADNRTIIVHAEPETIANPWALEGISVQVGTACGAFKAMAALADDIGEQWVMYWAKPEVEQEGTRSKTVWQWHLVHDAKEISSCLLLAANPMLVNYSKLEGLRLAKQGDPSFKSPPAKRLRKDDGPYSYERETLQEHVQRMLRVCEQPFFDRQDGQQRQPLLAELAYALRKTEARYGWETGALTQLARLVIAVHDLGKLDVRWQRWAHRWQEEVSKLRGVDLCVPANVMLAHTDYNGEDEQEKALNFKMRRERPNHAVEGAAAAMPVLLAEAGRKLPLVRAALTAVIGHHSAGAEGDHSSFQANQAAADAFEEIARQIGMKGVRRPVWQVNQGRISNRRIDFDSSQELLAYLYLVRILRMADQRSLSR